MWYDHSHVPLGFHQVNYPKADLWLQNEFVGCNLPVPITVRPTVADPGRGGGGGGGAGLTPIRPTFVFYFLFDLESFASIGSHITIQLVDFLLKRVVPFGTIKFQAYHRFNILLAYLLAFSYGKSPQTSKLAGEDTKVLIK